MLKVYNDCSPTIRTVERWFAQFKRGRTSLKDDPREGRPKIELAAEIFGKKGYGFGKSSIREIYKRVYTCH